MKNYTAKEITNQLSGKWFGSYGIAPCVCHDDKKPSLQISDKNGQLFFYCHAGCNWRDLRAKFINRGFLSKANGDHSVQSRPLSKNVIVNCTININKIWDECHPSESTPVEKYLGARGYNGYVPKTVKSHPRLWHSPSKSAHPAMVAAITVWPDKKPIGLHRTYLAKDGSGKANVMPNRMILGSTKGGAVRLNPCTETLI
jgi:hypothetical protein